MAPETGRPPASPAAHQGAPQRHAAAADAHAPYRTLVVDDDEQWRFLMRLLLRRTGRFDVVAEAADGEAAIQQAEAVRPDVVLLDLKMPVMRGDEALPQIRARAPEATVVVVSGMDAASTAGRMLELGAAGYIEKGASTASFEAALLAILEGGRTQP